ncbi:hypothetical protein ACW0JT_09775 [Arthrobacter sp. SA17]
MRERAAPAQVPQQPVQPVQVPRPGPPQELSREGISRSGTPRRWGRAFLVSIPDEPDVDSLSGLHRSSSAGVAIEGEQRGGEYDGEN